MNFDEPLEKILTGVMLVGLGIIMFAYTLKQTQKEKGNFNIYNFNLYFGSVMMVLGGLFLIYSGVKGLLLK
jgi:putative Mn2+ efflux pump MntP